jgi:hypothetical protein
LGTAALFLWVGKLSFCVDCQNYEYLSQVWHGFCTNPFASVQIQRDVVSIPVGCTVL